MQGAAENAVDDAAEMLLNREVMQEHLDLTPAESIYYLDQMALTLFERVGGSIAKARQLLVFLIRRAMEPPWRASRSSAVCYFDLMARAVSGHGQGETARLVFEQLLNEAEDRGEPWALEMARVLHR